MNTDTMAQVLKAFAEVVGREHLVAGDGQRRPYENTTFPTTPSVVAVVRPANTNEVQACVRVANRFGTPIYPTSTGKNTGYGSRVPTADGSINLCRQIRLGSSMSIPIDLNPKTFSLEIPNIMNS